MKQYVTRITLAAVMAVSMAAAVMPDAAEARVGYAYTATENWNGNYNYPKAYSHMGVDYYVDVSSAYIKAQYSTSHYDYTQIVANIVAVNSDTGKPIKTFAIAPILVVGEDGSAAAEIDSSGRLHYMQGYGFEQPQYNALFVLRAYFNDYRGMDI